jgi:ribosome maturation protein Sdo1
MKQEDYYKAPAQEIFDDIKENAIKIWSTYDDKFGYRTEKLNRIKDIQNVSDNAWYIVAMFDTNNQAKLLTMVKPKTATMIIDARGF